MAINISKSDDLVGPVHHFISGHVIGCWPVYGLVASYRLLASLWSSYPKVKLHGPKYEAGGGVGMWREL